MSAGPPRWTITFLLTVSIMSLITLCRWFRVTPLAWQHRHYQHPFQYWLSRYRLALNVQLDSWVYRNNPWHTFEEIEEEELDTVSLGSEWRLTILILGLSRLTSNLNTTTIHFLYNFCQFVFKKHFLTIYCSSTHHVAHAASSWCHRFLKHEKHSVTGQPVTVQVIDTQCECDKNLIITQSKCGIDLSKSGNVFTTSRKVLRWNFGSTLADWIR